MSANLATQLTLQPKYSSISLHAMINVQSVLLTFLMISRATIVNLTAMSANQTRKIAPIVILYLITHTLAKLGIAVPANLHATHRHIQTKLRFPIFVHLAKYHAPNVIPSTTVRHVQAAICTTNLIYSACCLHAHLKLCKLVQNASIATFPAQHVLFLKIIAPNALLIMAYLGTLA
jgi:hypothetical protein